MSNAWNLRISLVCTSYNVTMSYYELQRLVTVTFDRHCTLSYTVHAKMRFPIDIAWDPYFGWYQAISIFLFPIFWCNFLTGVLCKIMSFFLPYAFSLIYSNNSSCTRLSVFCSWKRSRLWVRVSHEVPPGSSTLRSRDSASPSLRKSKSTSTPFEIPLSDLHGQAALCKVPTGQPSHVHMRHNDIIHHTYLISSLYSTYSMPTKNKEKTEKPVAALPSGIGPTVWLLEGPMPIFKSSLVNNMKIKIKTTGFYGW